MRELARDKDWRLRCRFPMCHRVINGVTGLDEIHKLMAHVRRAHGQAIDMNMALELRARWEEPDIIGSDDSLAVAGLRREVNPVIE